MHRPSWLATTLVSSQAEKDAVTSKMQREWSAYSRRMRAAECTLLLAVGHSMAAAGSCRRPGISYRSFLLSGLAWLLFFLHGHMSKTKGPLINVCRLFSQQLKPNFSNVVESARVCNPAVSADGGRVPGATINKHFYYRKSLHFTISIYFQWSFVPLPRTLITSGQTQATTFHLSRADGAPSPPNEPTKSRFSSSRLTPCGWTSISSHVRHL